MRLELALGCANDAREISRTLPGSSDKLAILVLALRDLREQLTATVDPLIDDPGFTPLQFQLGRVADRFRGILSQSRYAYDVPEERDG